MAEGTRFGKYRLVELLGRGGMAEVWKAKLGETAGQERTLVIKRILPHLAADEELVAMFLREAQLSSMLTHPNIVEVFELGELQGEYYLAMEYVHGRDIHTVIAARPKTPPPPGLAALVAKDLGRALSYAHDVPDAEGRPLRVIHRDVTPANVMLTAGGHVKLVDFGVAKALSRASESLTAVGAVRGKLGYSAPELWLDGVVDHRSDLFSVGIMVHELLTGRRLFQADSDRESVERVLKAEVYAPSRINANVPTGLDDVVLRALERDPRRRFQSGDEMADAFEPFVRELAFGPTQVTALLRDRFPDLDSRRDDRFAVTQAHRVEVPEAVPDERSTVPQLRSVRQTVPVIHSIAEMGAWTDDATMVQTEPQPKLAPPPPRRSRAVWVIFAFVLVGATAEVAVYLRQARRSAIVVPPPAAPIVPIAPAPAPIAPAPIPPAPIAPPTPPVAVEEAPPGHHHRKHHH